jgi:hypothetical protein
MMTTRLDPLSRWGLQRTIGGVDDDRLVRLVAAAADDLERQLDQHQTAAAAVMADPGLNTAGRRTRLRALQDSTVAAINRLETSGLIAVTVRTLTAERTILQNALTNRLDFRLGADGVGLERRVPPAERPVHEQREREIRDRLLALDPVARVALAHTAALDNDVETLRAIAHAPRAFPVLAAADFAAVDRAHAEAHHAAEADGVRALDAALDTLRWNFTVTRRALGVADGAAVDAVAQAAGAPPPVTDADAS